MLNDTVEKTIAEKKLLQGCSSVTAALSGGGDSVALTHVLFGLQKKLGFKLSALHIHHGIRAASDREERQVRQFCGQLGIELTVVHVNAPALAAQKHISLESAARQARYGAFAEYLSARGGKIATAHHMDDAMETFLINLARGSGVKGLCSIPFERQDIFRPMLEARKSEILDYLRQNGLPFCEDESNADTYYLRNFLRAEVLPKLLERKDVDFAAGFAATLENLREEERFLSEQARPFYTQTDTRQLSALPPAILWRVLKHQYPPLTRAQFVRLKGKLGCDFKEQLSGAVATEKNHTLRFISPQTPIPRQRLTDGLTVGDRQITLKFFEEINIPFTNNMLDCDKITSDLYIRSRKAGDRITLCRRHVTKTLKKLFCEDRVENREQRIVVTDACDRVLYVEGYGVNLPFAADKNTRRFVTVDIRKNEGE